MKFTLLLLGLMLVVGTKVQATTIWAQGEVPGFAEIQPDGKYQGVAVDIVEAVLDQAKVDTKVVYLPAPRAFSNFIEGKVDYFITLYDERMVEYAEMGGMVGAIPQVALTLKSTQFDGFDDLYPMAAIGVMRGTVPVGPVFEDPKLKRVEVTDVHMGLRMLVNRRLDSVVVSKIGALKALNEHKMNGWVNWTKIGQMQFALYALKKHKGSAEFLQIKNALKQFVESGGVASGMDRHLGPFWRD